MKQLLFTTLLLTTLFAFAGCAHHKVAPDATDPAAVTATKAKAAAQTVQDELTCSKAKDVRTLEIVDLGAGCELKYDKMGKMTVATKAKKGTKHCVASETKIRKKLESAGFACAAKTG